MKRYSREQWAEWIDEQKCSGLTVSEFCKSIGVSANAFYWRRRRLAATAEAEKSSAASDVQASRSHLPQPSAFVAVNLVDGSSAAVVEVDLPCGAVVRVRDSHAISIVLASLREHGGAT